MSNDDAILRMCRTENRQNLMQHVQGLVTARVVRIEENGMYRLNFFGMNGQDGDSASTEARCMMPMAGGGAAYISFPNRETKSSSGSRRARRRRRSSSARSGTERTRRLHKRASRRATTSARS